MLLLVMTVTALSAAGFANHGLGALGPLFSFSIGLHVLKSADGPDAVVFSAVVLAFSLVLLLALVP